jgi:hypothetical protein
MEITLTLTLTADQQKAVERIIPEPAEGELAQTPQEYLQARLEEVVESYVHARKQARRAQAISIVDAMPQEQQDVIANQLGVTE